MFQKVYKIGKKIKHSNKLICKTIDSCQNQLRKFSRLRYSKYFYKLYPLTKLIDVYIAVEITNACNLRCVQCVYRGGEFEDYSRPVGFMDFEIYKKAIDELSKAGCKAILHNADGEATLHKEFLRFLEYVSKSNIKKIHFNTNGMLWNKDFIDKLLRFYKGSVYFSLDGFKEDHERIRVGSDYDRVFSNINYLLEKRGKNGNTYPIVGVGYCNYDQPAGVREKFVDFWVGKVDVVSLCETFDKDTKIISKRMADIKLPKKRNICLVPWGNLEIGWNGDIIPCSTYVSKAKHGVGIMGNIKNQTLKEIWTGKLYNEFRKKHIYFDFKDMFCQKCERWQLWENIPPSEYKGYLVLTGGVFKTYHNKYAQKELLGFD